MCDIVVMYDGYSNLKNKHEMKANCSCTLIKGFHNIVVDTMTSWDRDKIILALKKEDLTVDDISYVISTHGHSDHIGNNNLFLKAKHIVGFSVSFKDDYYLHPFDEGEEFKINNNVKVIPTPGHTLTDVTVLVISNSKETVALTGDLFEKFEDIEDPGIWLDAGSEDEVLQRKNRSKVAQLADWIVPGHGPKFKVTDEIREILLKQIHIQS
ncbi:metallo-beta-lactamase domain-containing protein 1-like isoform X1 [Melitaea cinxia]|uniref:metallo-beta-lactamase domain-containing protein 1-like isoform X1 n=1 Tax=Melitaea cinxia TaxID=113334 RepID=UPI001E2722BF|nr:metallo-beta-lactamase domain-containing protein 1-like isoform X1 [Melitaea cinxia]XP_045458712.1 metallo-beta-lactamase domain-containing protein 1-like isoform X1 [Melitaea cinxia]